MSDLLLAENRLLLDWCRDLSVCTADEVRERWQEDELKAIDHLEREAWGNAGGVEARLEQHNPLYFLAERVWFDNVKDNPKYLYAPYHRDLLCRPMMEYVLDKNSPYVGFLFLGPRDSYKSTFAHGVLPMWFLLRKKFLENYDARIVLRHHKELMASEHLLWLKAKFLTHPWMRQVWPEACPPQYSKEFGTKTAFTLPWVVAGTMAESSVRALGLSASDTGHHSDLDCGDDLVTEDHITSKVVRDDARLRYQAKRFTVDTKGGKEVNTGTRYHANDLWGTFEKANINGKPLYKIQCISAIADDGTLVLPYLLTNKFLEDRLNEIVARDGNPWLWYLQYQNKIKISGLVATQPWWIRRIHRNEVPVGVFPIVLADGAWKGEKNHGEGDYASIQVWGFLRNAGVIYRYLLDGVHSNDMSSLDGEREILRLCQKYGTNVVGVEEHGGHAFRTGLRHTANGQGFPIVLVDFKSKQTGKPQRIVAFIKECEAGRVYVCEEIPIELKEALVGKDWDGGQFADYPQVDHDDAIDCAAYSCDPNVADAWTPSWASATKKLRPWQMRAPVEDAPRTRHCGS